MKKIAVIGSLALAACTNPSDHQCAAPESAPIISDVVFHWDTHMRAAPGSDNWPITWSDDDHQYTAWGDGGGFGGTNRNGRVSLGFARVEGDRAGLFGNQYMGWI